MDLNVGLLFKGPEDEEDVAEQAHCLSNREGEENDVHSHYPVRGGDGREGGLY